MNMSDAIEHIIFTVSHSPKTYAMSRDNINYLISCLEKAEENYSKQKENENVSTNS